MSKNEQTSQDSPAESGVDVEAQSQDDQSGGTPQESGAPNEEGGGGGKIMYNNLVSLI